MDAQRGDEARVPEHHEVAGRAGANGGAHLVSEVEAKPTLAKPVSDEALVRAQGDARWRGSSVL
jgi:hypothetical protein